MSLFSLHEKASCLPSSCQIPNARAWDKQIGCRSGAVGMDGMEKVDFIDDLTPTYGGRIDALSHI